MNIHIRGGRLVDPFNGVDAHQDLFLQAGRVVAIGDHPAGFEVEEVVEAEGCVVAPGFIDLQAHLREPGLTQKGTIETETAAAAASGVTTLCCPPLTQPVIDTPAVVQLILDRAAEAGYCRVLPLGAFTRGLEGEQLSNMVALKEAGCVAFTNARRPLPSNRTLMRCLEYAATHDLLVMVQAQDPGLGAGGCAHDGATADRLGLAGIPETAETVDVARHLLLAEQTGARLHFGQLSSRASLRMIEEARARGLRVSCDLAVHQLIFSDADLSGFDSRFHLLPPLRSQADRDGLRQGLASGSVDAVCSDHQPHEAAAKAAPFAATEPGMSSLETLLPLALALVEQGVLTLDQLVARLTVGPARVLGLAHEGLKEGALADICVFDPVREWSLTAESSRSRGLNSPLLGQPLKGQVRTTLLEGRVVFRQP
ncbi:dihydroorotase [Motiliproteus sp. SC1-56]|uniref:dihydroorotase n=1 Tax=Motiliproteus sp. SC1-56 TaxID=2799565 RepID=UPI001A8C680B|nr:dihydroorotase [Motiliproteus sp. SC1-56]